MATQPNTAPARPNARFPPQSDCRLSAQLAHNPPADCGHIAGNTLLNDALCAQFHWAGNYWPTPDHADVAASTPSPHLCFQRPAPTHRFYPALRFVHSKYRSPPGYWPAAIPARFCCDPGKNKSRGSNHARLALEIADFPLAALLASPPSRRQNRS